MNRRPRNVLPASDDVLKPTLYDSNKVKQHMDAQKVKQKHFYDQRKGVKELSPLEEGTLIRMKTPNSKTLSPGTVVNKTDKPRSYIVESNGRLYRRNRKHLRRTTKPANEKQSVPYQEVEDFNNIEVPNVENPTIVLDDNVVLNSEPKQSTAGITTRSGREVKQPKRLDL